MVRRRRVTENGVQALKFSGLGAVNFVLTFLVFTVLLEVLLVNYIISLFLAWFTGMLFMYVTNFVWVFQSRSSLRFDARFVKFLATGIISITGNMLALHFLVEHVGAAPFFMQILLIPPVVGFNFLAAKYFSFRQRNAVR